MSTGNDVQTDTTEAPRETEPETDIANAAEHARSARRKRRLIRLGLLALTVLAGIAVAYVAVGRFRPHLYSGTVLQASEAPPLSGLDLASGAEADLAAFEGNVVLIYFGYTNCPDICPTTLSTAAKARAQLSDSDQERVTVLMVSVDPDRDDIDSAQEYVGFFDPDFLAAAGPKTAVDEVTSSYGIYYAFGEGTPETGYTVDHTANLIGIDGNGDLRVIWDPTITSDQLATDLEELL